MASGEAPSLVGLIKERFKRSVVVPPLVSSDYIRASSLSNLCPREEVLASRLKVDRVDEVSVDSNLTFAMGTGAHWVFQNEVCQKLAEFGESPLVGQWVCRICGERFGGRKSKLGDISLPSDCIFCGSPEFGYVEQQFVDELLRLTGHNDGFLRFPDFPGDGLLELKSISHYRAADIRDVPDMGHAVQVQAYMRLTGCKWALIIYWDKGVFRDSLTEHFVERDEDTIKEIEAELASIWEGIRTGALPERICSSADCRRADDCVLAEDCFRYSGYVPECKVVT